MFGKWGGGGKRKINEKEGEEKLILTYHVWIIKKNKRNKLKK